MIANHSFKNCYSDSCLFYFFFFFWLFSFQKHIFFSILWLKIVKVNVLWNIYDLRLSRHLMPNPIWANFIHCSFFGETNRFWQKVFRGKKVSWDLNWRIVSFCSKIRKVSLSSQQPNQLTTPTINCLLSWKKKPFSCSDRLVSFVSFNSVSGFSSISFTFLYF
jgi:hypothetical protein